MPVKAWTALLVAAQAAFSPELRSTLTVKYASYLAA